MSALPLSVSACLSVSALPLSDSPFYLLCPVHFKHEVIRVTKLFTCDLMNWISFAFGLRRWLSVRCDLFMYVVCCSDGAGPVHEGVLRIAER